MLAKVSGVDLVAKEAKYHHSCKSAYLMSVKRVPSQREPDSEEMEVPSGTLIDNIHSYFEQSVIRNKRPELLTSLFTRYLDMCTLSDVKNPLKQAKGRGVTSSFEHLTRTSLSVCSITAVNSTILCGWILVLLKRTPGYMLT